TRDMIRKYAIANGITWREDASNATDDYQRNFIRHEVIRKFKDMNPAFEDGFRHTHERLLGAREFALSYIHHVRSEAVTDESDTGLMIDIARVRQSKFAAVLLWELIKDFGFKYDQCIKIVEDHQPGRL